MPGGAGRRAPLCAPCSPPTPTGSPAAASPEPAGRDGGRPGRAPGRGERRAGGRLFLCVDLDAGRSGALSRPWCARLPPSRPEWLPAERLRTAVELEFDEPRERVAAWKRTRYEDLVIAEAEVPAAGAAEHRAAPRPGRRRPSGPRPAAGRSRGRRLPGPRALPGGLACPSWACRASASEEIRAAPPRPGRRPAVLRRAAPGAAAATSWGPLSYEQLEAVRREAPERLEVPSGSHIRLAYEPGKPPVLAARIQELFGLAETPRVAGGRVPVLLHLLAPNGRPQQVTHDLPELLGEHLPAGPQGARRPLSRSLPRPRPLDRHPAAPAGAAARLAGTNIEGGGATRFPPRRLPWILIPHMTRTSRRTGYRLPHLLPRAHRRHRPPRRRARGERLLLAGNPADRGRGRARPSRCAGDHHPQAHQLVPTRLPGLARRPGSRLRRSETSALRAEEGRRDSPQIRRYRDTFPNLLVTNFYDLVLSAPRSGGPARVADLPHRPRARARARPAGGGDRARVLDLLQIFFAGGRPRLRPRPARWPWPSPSAPGCSPSTSSRCSSGRRPACRPTRPTTRAGSAPSTAPSSTT